MADITNQLSEERSCYSKLQQSTDSELDTLRQQQQHLRTQLDTTTRKLENLTDIERQLSCRVNISPSSSAVPDSDTPKQEDVKHMTSRKPPAHLLLVDDDPGLLKLLGMRLVSEGYSVDG